MNKITPERLAQLAVWMGKDAVVVVVKSVDTALLCNIDGVGDEYQPHKDPAQAFELLEKLIKEFGFVEVIGTLNLNYIFHKDLQVAATLTGFELAGV